MSDARPSYDELLAVMAAKDRRIAEWSAAEQQANATVAVARELVPDETGWRVARRLAWLRVAVAPSPQCATAYAIDRKRGFDGIRELRHGNPLAPPTCGGVAVCCSTPLRYACRNLGGKQVHFGEQGT